MLVGSCEEVRVCRGHLGSHSRPMFLSQSLSVGIGFSVRSSRASLRACIPSLCGMLVYRDATSRVKRIAPVGISLSESSRIHRNAHYVTDLESIVEPYKTRPPMQYRSTLIRRDTNSRTSNLFYSNSLILKENPYVELANHFI